MKKVLGLSALALAGVLAFTGCSCGKDKETTGTAYGLVHGKGYVGKAVVTHIGNDVTAVEFDEMQLVSDWAKVVNGKYANSTTTAAEQDYATVKYLNHRIEKDDNFAKKVKIGDVIFTLDTTNAADSSVAVKARYKTQDGVTLAAYLEDAAHAEWYFNTMAAGNYDVLKADGNPAGLAYTGKAAKNENLDYTKGNRWRKSVNEYWTAAAPTGWVANTQAMATYIVENDPLADYSKDNYVQDATTKKWTYHVEGQTDVVTGATLVDFNEYVGLAATAFKK